MSNGLKEERGNVTIRDGWRVVFGDNLEDSSNFRFEWKSVE